MTELRGQIEAYADGKISRQAFELWFFQLSFDVEKAASEPIIALIHQVEGLLAESSSAEWCEEELRKELRIAIKG